MLAHRAISASRQSPIPRLTEGCRLLSGNETTDLSERAFRCGRLPQQNERFGEIAKGAGGHRFARDECDGKHARPGEMLSDPFGNLDTGWPVPLSFRVGSRAQETRLYQPERSGHRSSQGLHAESFHL
jgi:hypothetical protein